MDFRNKCHTVRCLGGFVADHLLNVDDNESLKGSTNIPEFMKLPQLILYFRDTKSTNQKKKLSLGTA